MLLDITVFLHYEHTERNFGEVGGAGSDGATCVDNGKLGILFVYINVDTCRK